MRLKGQVAIITGAARNLGKEIAQILSSEGAHTIIADMDAAEAEKSYAQIKNAYPTNKGFAVQVDVRKSHEVEAMVNEVLGKLRRIDILVNNAGFLTAGLLIDLSEKEYDRVMDTNVKGIFLCSRAVLPHMMKRKRGRIINIGSNAGKTGINFLTHYCASKFAVIGFTQALAQEMIPYNIAVNCICPGNLNLPQHFEATEGILKIQDSSMSLEEALAEQKSQRILGRLGEPKDIANLIVFLASDEAEYISGDSINVAGGSEFH